MWVKPALDRGCVVMKLSSRKVGGLFAVLFIAGLIICTVYSRGYAEMQKPLVQIVAAESRAVVWSYETRGIVRMADFPHSENYEFTADIIVQEDDYSSHMSEFLMTEGWPVRLNIAGWGYLTPGQIVHRGDVYGDIRLTIGFTPSFGSMAAEDEIGIMLELEMDSMPYTVPESAVYFDSFSNQHYLYFVTRREGAWDREYVLVRQDITFGLPRRVDSFANVSGGPNFNLPIVSWSDKPLYDGAVVRLYG